VSRPPKPKFNRLYKFAGVVLILNALVCLKSLELMSKAIERVVFTRETVSVVDRVFVALKDAEIGFREYLLSGTEPDRARVEQLVFKVDQAFDDLIKRAKGDALFEAQVAGLRHVAYDRNEQLLELAEVRKKQGLEAAVQDFQARRGQRTSAEVLRLVTAIVKEEDQRLLEATASARLAIARTFFTVTLASMLALLLLGVVYFVTRREIARREAAAQAIREREEWFSATLSGISDAVIATDDTGHIRFINPVAQSLTGWGLSESTGKPLGEVFPLVDEDSRSPVESPVSRVLIEGVSVGLSNHALLVARDGTEHPVEHCGAPIRDTNGAITGVVLCFRDVAERRRAEMELRASKESADAANRAKDQFLAVLSHELRKPLTPVLIAVTGMLDRNTKPDLRPLLEMIRRNVEIESRLIDDLLDVSRIARGGLRIHTEVVEAHEAIRQAVEMCHAETLLANLEVVLELSAREHHVLADETRIMQVFWNLITNATKFTPKGGRLEIHTRNERPADRSLSAIRLVIEFRDTGIGIEPESISRIFEPFEQGDGSFRRQYGGLGLGLAISRGIVESLGGLMTASSPGRGKGATFRLEFSAVPASVPAPPISMPSSSPHQSRRLRLLLVEDNPDTLRYLALMLGQRGHEVRTAHRLGAAKAALGEGKFDLLISDIELPDGSGLELMREAGDLPGIAMSGFGSEVDVRLSESAGFSMHLTKPIDVRKLEEAIHHVIARHTSSI
jgi:PAS domain S-box-containing protein